MSFWITDEKKLKALEKYALIVLLIFSLAGNVKQNTERNELGREYLEYVKAQAAGNKEGFENTQQIVKILLNERPKIIDTVYSTDRVHHK
jgi:hypothetical protein